MCLINFQLHEHPNYKLVVAANRDEFYKRPTAIANFWEDEPTILAGRDLEQMGTWLGITKEGRFAALTNYRAPDHMKASNKLSRGEIVKNYLAGNDTPINFLERLKENKDAYVGFNVIIGNAEEMFYYNNIENKVTKLKQGKTYGLSNHFLNTPWPKVIKGRENLRKYMSNNDQINENELFDLLLDAEEAGDEKLPNTGIGIDLERKLSPLFIQLPDYGTRCSTVLTIDKDNHVKFIERTYENGHLKEEKKFSFTIE